MPRTTNASLAAMTRFALGGPADLLVDADTVEEFADALQSTPAPHIVLGGGTNLVVSDECFRGTVVRYRGSRIEQAEDRLIVESGADWEALVVYAVQHGLAGIESMMRIPGWVSGAVYGNAGAYGQAIADVVTRVEILDNGARRWIPAAECGFRYRSSAFKQNRHWRILAAEFTLRRGDPSALQARAEEIRATRDAKFPPSMRCAGSIFKNCFVAALPAAAAARVPANVVREGKVPSAWFLEQVGSKGMVRGGIRVADYHANLIYNAGGGTAAEVTALIDELKARVAQEFGFSLEEEVQFIGFTDRVSH